MHTLCIWWSEFGWEQRRVSEYMIQIYTFLIRKFLFQNSIWTAPCTIPIFHPQEDMKYHRQKIPVLFSVNFDFY